MSMIDEDSGDELSLREFANMKTASKLIDNYIIWNEICRRNNDRMKWRWLEEV